MKSSAFSLALLTVLLLPMTAHAQLDLRHQQCGLGDQDACFSIQFGRCANENPRIAIPACTRELAQPDDRRRGGNVRFERAVRYALRAMAHAKQGNPDRALLDYDRSVSSHAGVFWIQMQRGEAYFLAGDNEEALESYDAAVTLNPDSVLALIYRAMILAAAPEDDLRNASQAILDAQKANQLESGQPAYIDVLAVAYAANGEFEKAVEEAQRAISLLPANNRSARDDYESRLMLYRQATPFRMDP